MNNHRRSIIYYSVLFVLLVINIGLFFLLLTRTQKTHQLVQKVTRTFTEVAQLKKRVYSFKELSLFFTTVANTKGAAYAYDLLKVAPIAPNTDMHLLGHIVGDILYKQQGAEGIKICTNDFRNACSHSIVVALFLKDGVKAIDTISKVCQKAPGGKGAYTMCFHGLGHGVLAYTKYDMKEAVSLCKKTGTVVHRNREYSECVGGVTMEMISGVHDPALRMAQAKNYFKKDDPLSPCDTDVVPNDSKEICYIYLTPHLFELAGADLGNPTEINFKGAFEICDQLKEEPYRHACFNGFGKEFVVLAMDRDIRNVSTITDSQLKNIHSWCLLSSAVDGQNSCIESAVSSLYWGGENDRVAAVKFCNTISDESNQTVCIRALIGAVGYYIDDKNYRTSFCNEIPKTYTTSCQRQLQV